MDGLGMRIQDPNMTRKAKTGATSIGDASKGSGRPKNICPRTPSRTPKDTPSNEACGISFYLENQPEFNEKEGNARLQMLLFSSSKLCTKT